MTMSGTTKGVVVVAVIAAAAMLLRLVNLKRPIRGRQILTAYLAPVFGLCGLAAAYGFYDRIAIAEDHVFSGAETLIWNLLIVAAFLIVKLSLLPVMKTVWRKNARMEQTSAWYEHDTDYDEWFLKLRYRNVKEVLHVLSWVVAGICAATLAAGWILGKESALYLRIFPCAALIIVTEMYNYLSGYTKPEYLYSVDGEDVRASRINAYYKLKKIYETMFPAALLFSHTGNEYAAKQGASELIDRLLASKDPRAQMVGEYFFHQKKKNGLFDVDMVSVTNKLLHKESVVIWNPFYRDLGDYLLLPIVDTLIQNKHCLIVVGRSAVREDVAAWAAQTLRTYSKARSLWRVGALSAEEPDCEVGILSFSQLYDADVINANDKFWEETGLVLFLEPSKMLATAQSGLGIVVERIGRQTPPVYCICDHDVDGLVDAMSHVLQTDLTNVVAAPVPRSVYTAMGWDASGDYMRQKLFDKQTHYLWNGIELAAVALKNQVPRVTWYSAEKVPVQDVRWIAGQYYPQICRYAHLPNQQKCLDERISFSPNLWGTAAEEEAFVIAEDEFCNLFASLRAYLTRGTARSFVNIISENYLLRDYMRYNRQLFMTDPKAVPAIAPHYVKTERNTVLRLILMMACSPVRESYIAHELSLLGYDTTDVYQTLSRLICHYTFVDEMIITVQNHQELDETFSPVQYCCYSISRQLFEEKFSDTLKNAFFVVEDEKFQTECVDARLFGHLTQLVMPGQYVTYSGKQYQVHSVSPQVGCVLHRAADTCRNRVYYRQLRTYDFSEVCEVISNRKVMDIEIALERRAFDVTAKGYLEMLDNHDLRSARVVDLSDDPGIGAFTRSYKHKAVLRIALPETDVRMRFTICVLLGEVLRSVFPDAWPYLAVLCVRPEDIEGMLDKFSYRVAGAVDENMIYLVEDSDMDLGLLEAVDSNLMRLFEILADYLAWHFEKMRESPAADPVLAPIETPSQEDRIRKSFFSRIAKRIMRLFAAEEETAREEPGEAQEKPPAEETEAPPTDSAEEAECPFEEETAENPDADQIAEPAGEAYAELSADFDLHGENSGSGETPPAEDSAGTDTSQEEIPSNAPSALPEEQIILHTEGEDLFAVDGVGDDLDLLLPIQPSRYQKECFLKLGFEEIDARLSIEEVSSYLTVRGWSNSDLTKARKRKELDSTRLDLDAENFCDFCGVPLSGVSYDRLSDGRTRCNDCSMTAINQVSEFRHLFRNTEAMMENTFEITIPVSIAVRMTDARTIGRHTGHVFTPSTKVTARVLGFAQVKGGKYSLFVESGSPRLASIDMITHELTHIWQYLNWDDRQIRSVYAQAKPAYTRLARDIVYEGMAVWSTVQMLYALGEISYAQQQEQLAASRGDIYGAGFRLYRDRFDLVRSGDAPVLSPFASFPPLDPEEVRKIFEGGDPVCPQ